MNPEQFVNALKNKGIDLNEEQLHQFDIYFKMLVEWNKKINLTTLTNEEDVYLKHFYDSITAAFYYDFTQKIYVCDVGAGAGFPSIPLKICFPHLKIAIIDSLNKRIGFLNRLASELGIDQVNFYHGRAEDFGSNIEFREKFDVVMARAVARMSVLSELCLPFNKINGVFIGMKGSQANEELTDAKKAIKVLGGRVKKVDTFTLPKEESERSIIIIDKKKATPKKYPIKEGTPNRNPIK